MASANLVHDPIVKAAAGRGKGYWLEDGIKGDILKAFVRRSWCCFARLHPPGITKGSSPYESFFLRKVRFVNSDYARSCR